MHSGKVRDFTKGLKEIHAAEDWKAAAEERQTVIAELCALKLKEAAERCEESGHVTLTVFVFPDRHWIKLRTSTPLERNLTD